MPVPDKRKQPAVLFLARLGRSLYVSCDRQPEKAGWLPGTAQNRSYGVDPRPGGCGPRNTSTPQTAFLGA